MKALLPFLKDIKTNNEAFAEYLTFQYTIGEKTLFDGVYQLLPGHALKIKDGDLIIKINDKDIRDFDLEKDETLFEILKESLNENNNKILLQNTKGEKYIYDMDLVELESMDYYYDIYLKYIKINDKEINALR